MLRDVPDQAVEIPVPEGGARCGHVGRPALQPGLQHPGHALHVAQRERQVDRAEPRERLEEGTVLLAPVREPVDGGGVRLPRGSGRRDDRVALRPRRAPLERLGEPEARLRVVGRGSV